MKSIIKLIILALCFSACNDDLNNLSSEAETPVVEGFLFAGQPLDSLKITQSYSYSREDTSLITLDNLQVSIKDESDQTYILTNIGNGIYQNLDFKPLNGSIYTLEFQHNQEKITATTFVPIQRNVNISTTEIELQKIEFSNGFPSGGFGEIPDPVEITWDNPEGDYYYVVVENLEDNPEYVNELVEQLEEDGSIPRFFQITEPEITDFHAINARQLTQYGNHRIIVYRVNPEYAALYESEGTSSVTIAQPPTNIENGLGIFTGVSSDTVYLEVEKL